MYARVSAKKAKLYSEKDYNRFLKMEVNEISRKMEEGSYSKEINQLGSEFSGADLIERSLNLNLSNTFQHLLKISSEDAKPIVQAYIRRFDITQYKRILRWKEGNQEDRIEHIVNLTQTIGLTFEEIKEMTQEEIIESIQFEDSSIDYQERIRKCKSQKEIETCLDKAYAEEMREVAGNTRSKEFQTYVKTEQLYHDIELILRLKKYGLEPEEIRENLTSDGHNKLEPVIQSSDLDSAINHAKEITDATGENLEELEHSIEQRRLQEASATLHREPLGLSSTIGYMVAKTIEVENLRMIARAKETGIQNRDTIKNNLVIA